MRVPELQPFAAGASALLLIASMGWWLFSAPELAEPGQPTWKGADVVQLTAAIPKISEFEHFYVNHDNPFVPHNQRVVERGVYDPRTRPPAPPPPRPSVTPPPKSPVVVLEPEKPKLVLPRLVPAPSNAPITYGMLVSDGEEMVIVRMPDDQSAVNLKPGDKIAGWTLISIDNGNLATFLDPQGVEHRFAIGQGDLVAVQNASDQVPPNTKPTGPTGKTPPSGMVPKAPNPGAPGIRPGVPSGSTGTIPRPPPREERPRIIRRPDGSVVVPQK